MRIVSININAIIYGKHTFIFHHKYKLIENMNRYFIMVCYKAAKNYEQYSNETTEYRYNLTAYTIFGYRGIVGLDFIVENIKLFQEINPRFNASSFYRLDFKYKQNRTP